MSNIKMFSKFDYPIYDGDDLNNQPGKISTYHEGEHDDDWYLFKKNNPTNKPPYPPGGLSESCLRDNCHTYWL